MRKLPETFAKVIREFEEKNGRFVSRRLVCGAKPAFAPDDDAFEPHHAAALARVLVFAADGELRAEGELPSGSELHASLIEREVAVGGLFVEAAIEDQSGFGRCGGAGAFSHEAGRF